MFIEKLFDLEKNNSSIKQEMIAGATTWLTMVYIVVVNPLILSACGMDFGSVFVATCCAAAFGSLMMGVVANYPIALAPGMGLNAFFVYSIVGAMGMSWQVALGAVLWSGILFIILSLVKAREKIINSLPSSIKTGAAIGIGLFLAIIGLGNAGVIEQGNGTLLALGDIHSLPVLLTAIGFIIITALFVLKKNWAVIAGILAVSVVAWILDDTTSLNGLVGLLPPSITPTFLALDLKVSVDVLYVTVVFSLLFVDVFDTSGTIVAVAKKGGLMDSEGKIPRLDKVLLADSTATVVGAFLGTSTTTSYIESNAGIAAGGKTGLTAVVVALLFMLTLFFAPLAESIPAYATAPALIFVAILLIGTLSDFKDWDDFSESAPLVITAIMMPLTFSIADGLAIGCLVYTAIKLLSGKLSDVSPTMAVLSIVFLFRFLFLVNL